HRPERAGHAGGQDRPPRRPRRIHQPRHRRREPGGSARRRGPAACGARAPRPDRLAPHRRARPRPRRDLGPRRRHSPERGRRRCHARAPNLHVRDRVPRRSSPGRARPRPLDDPPDLRAPRRARRLRRRRDRLRRRDDRPLRTQLRRVARVVARIKDASVREAVEAADMVEVVSARTQLRRAGARYTGLCPFHDEKTPSFSVNPADKLFYCFGCGKGGDLITFVRETEQLDFAEAVEWLAERYRVSLEYEESSPERDAERNRRERLLALLEQAAAFYERYLWDSDSGEPAREYLRGRGLGADVCHEYRLGLAPGGATLARKAQEKGFTAAELRSAGLVNRRGNDYFAGRLPFPLAAAQGFDVRVVALPPGTDPADDPERFEERLAGAESYLVYRVRLEIERAPDRQEAFVRVREALSRFEDSPERQDAVRLAADRLDLPKETQ